MDFFKKSCNELCTKLVDESIANQTDLNDFVEAKCKEYNKTKTKEQQDAVYDKEKDLLDPIYKVFQFKKYSLGENYNYIKFKMAAESSKVKSEDLIIMGNYTKYLKKMKDALTSLAKPSNVKFFSIFLGVGTGKYYKEAVRKIEEKIGENEELLEEVNSGLFKGLPNGENYCYLNTALQELYRNPDFRRKVLISEPPEDEKYQKLISTKFFFEYLDGRIRKSDFEVKRKEMAKKLGYNGNQQNSATAKRNIESACINQIRQLRSEPSLTTLEIEQKETDTIKQINVAKQWKNFIQNLTTEGEKQSFINSAAIIEELYDEQQFRNKVLAIDENELTLKDYAKLEAIVKLFKLKEQGDTKFYSEESYQLVLSLGNNQTYKGIKEDVLSKINQFNRSKKAYILSSDSTFDIAHGNLENTVKQSLTNCINQKRKKGMPYYLPLKDNEFSVQFSDRQGYELRKNFSVEETLDLSDLIGCKALKIFVDGKLIKGKYEFKLISASIGTGGHYYLYKKVGSTWKEFNDSIVTNHTWGEIEDDINKKCETLTYKFS